MDRENFTLESYKHKLKCVIYQKMHIAQKTYNYDMDMCDIEILPQTVR